MLTFPLFPYLNVYADWIPFAFIAFAICFSAAFSFRPPPALAIMALAAAINWLIILEPGDSVILPGADILGGAIGPLFIIITGPCLVAVNEGWRAAAKRADRERTTLMEVVVRNDRALQVQGAQDAVDRRIHETLLNTLTFVASLVETKDLSLVRAQCRRDLDQAEIPVTGEPVLMSALIYESISSSAISPIDVSVDLGDDRYLSKMVAKSIRDSVFESLRNVKRHSGATMVAIATRADPENLRIRISDNGIGIPLEAIEKFGVRNTLRRSMEALGGSATVTGKSEVGTVVTLHIPLPTTTGPFSNSQPTSESVNDSLAARLGMISPSISGFILILGMPGHMANPLPPILLFLLFVSLNLALAFAWKSHFREPLAIATLGAAACTYLVTRLSLDGCSSASYVHWLIICVTGSVFLLNFALSSKSSQWLGLPVLTILAIWMTFGLPAGCRGVPAMAILATIGYVSAAIYCANWLFIRIDHQRREAELYW
ncbi:MAG: ATP-binding protein, partial [Actinomycetes bacterium]